MAYIKYIEKGPLKILSEGVEKIITDFILAGQVANE
jgi:hypothetical protein